MKSGVVQVNVSGLSDTLDFVSFKEEQAYRRMSWSSPLLLLGQKDFHVIFFLFFKEKKLLIVYIHKNLHALGTSNPFVKIKTQRVIVCGWTASGDGCCCRPLPEGKGIQQEEEQVLTVSYSVPGSQGPLHENMNWISGWRASRQMLLFFIAPWSRLWLW